MTTNQSKQANGTAQWPRPALLLALGFVLGLSTERSVDLLGSMACASSRMAANFRLISEAWSTIDQHYVDRTALRNKDLTYGAIDGMVDALGDTGHSTFLSPAMVKRVREAEEGRLRGIGVEIQAKDGHVIVVAPLDGSPAFRAGLRHGDIILKVDGRDITSLPISQVVARITGVPGTSVSLTIQDPTSGRSRDVSMVRASIKLESVTWQRLPGTSIAHLRVASFEEGTGKDLRKALTEIERAGIDGIILDLRNNPGGILDSAIDVASQFLRSGNVLLVKDAQDRVKPVPIEKGSLAVNVPMAVLINGGSASGAEIVAGALKDNHRATLVGQTTFGTGTVLQEFPLSDGSALLLAVQEWLTPSGQSFWHKGIDPNVRVSLPPEADILLPEEEETMTAGQLQASGDVQLLRALAVLSKDGEAR